MKTTLLLVFVGLAMPAASTAQPICLDAETAMGCLNRLSAVPTPAAGEAEKKTQVDIKKKTETGELDPSTGLSSSMKDFLPLLRFTGVLGDFTKDDDTGVVTVALNTPLGGKDPSVQAKALIETKPKLFAPLKKALPENTRDDIAKKLLNVTNKQNVTVQLSYNVTNRSLGRSFELYQPLLDNIFQATYVSIRPAETLANALLGEIAEIVTRARAVKAAATTFTAAAGTLVRPGGWTELGGDKGQIKVQITGTKLNDGNYTVTVTGATMTALTGGKFVDEIGPAVVTRTDDIHDPGSTPWSELPVEKRTEVENAIAAGRAAGALKLHTTFSEVVRKSGLDMFGQLVNNQPQLHFTWSKALRDELYGPRSFSGRVSWEMGLGNSLNTFRKKAAGKCDQDGSVDAAGCLAALATFTSRADTKAKIKAGTRLAVFAEFTQVGDYSKVIAEHNVNVAFAKGTGWAAGLDFGRLVGVSDDGTASARVDGAFRYEWPANSVLGNERMVASFTLTKKFSDTSVPFGLVYANKPEFLKDVDHQLSAHVGVMFNLFGLK